MPPFRIETRDEATERQIWVFGEIDLLTVDEFRSALKVAPRRRLLVDLQECRFMDLAGLRALEEARDNSSLTVIPSPQVRRLLELTATTHQFDVEIDGFVSEGSGHLGLTPSDE